MISRSPSHLLLDVVSVEIIDDTLMQLMFENGEKRRFDIKPWLSKKPFHELSDPTLFSQASVKWGTVCWPNGVDMAPETLYEKSVPVNG